MSDLLYMALKATMLGAFLLAILMWICGIIQGSKTARTGQRLKEDGKGKNFGTDANDERALDNSARWLRIVGNNMENIPLSLAIAVCAAFAVTAFYIQDSTDDRNGTDNRSARAQEIVHVAAFGAFVILRWIYVAMYAFALQPFRSIIYWLSVIAVCVFAVNGIVAAFRLTDHNIDPDNNGNNGNNN